VVIRIGLERRRDVGACDLRQPARVQQQLTQRYPIGAGELRDPPHQPVVKGEHIILGKVEH
jgi:hypothetical protein